MTRLILAVLALAPTACGVTPPPASSGAGAPPLVNELALTDADEKALGAAELAYTIAHGLVMGLIAAGVVDEASAARLVALDARLLAALEAARAAYRAANAADLRAAIAEAARLAAELDRVLGRR